MNKERRGSPRTHSTVPLDLYDPRGRMITGEGHFVNISETGGLIETQKPLRVRQSLRLQIQAPGKSPLDLSGQVVWAKKKHSGFSYGIKFRSTGRA